MMNDDDLSRTSLFRLSLVVVVSGLAALLTAVGLVWALVTDDAALAHTVAVTSSVALAVTGLLYPPTLTGGRKTASALLVTAAVFWLVAR